MSTKLTLFDQFYYEELLPSSYEFDLLNTYENLSSLNVKPFIFTNQWIDHFNFYYNHFYLSNLKTSYPFKKYFIPFYEIEDEEDEDEMIKIKKVVKLHEPFTYPQWNETKTSSKNKFYGVKLNFGFANYSFIPRDKMQYFYLGDKISEYLFNSFELNNNLKNFMNENNLNVLTNNTYFNYPINSSLSFGSKWMDYSDILFFNNYNNVNLINDFSKVHLLGFNDMNSESSLSLLELKTPSSLLSFNIKGKYSLANAVKALKKFDKCMWKTYRLVYSEGRSSIFYKNFTTSYLKSLYIDSTLPKFNDSIKKNSVSFIKSNFYKKSIYNSSLNKLMRLDNNFYYEFPFFISNMSDIIRYMWVDWYSRSLQRMSKALDLNYYGLNGNKKLYSIYSSIENKTSLLYKNKKSTAQNYLTRVSSSRKLYLPSWTFSAFNYMKSRHSTQLNYFRSLINNSNDLFKFLGGSATMDKAYFYIDILSSGSEFTTFKLLKEYLDLEINEPNSEFSTKKLVNNSLSNIVSLDISFMYYFDLYYNYNIVNFNDRFYNAFSSQFLQTRNFWWSSNQLSNLSNFYAKLNDILSRREYLLRNYYTIHDSLIPDFFLNNFKQVLHNDIKSSFGSNVMEKTNEVYKIMLDEPKWENSFKVKNKLKKKYFRTNISK